MESTLTRTFLDNTLSQYLVFAAILLSGLFLKRGISWIFTRIIYRIFRKFSREVGFTKLMELLKKPFGTFISILTIYAAFMQLHFPESWHLADRSNLGLRLFLFKGTQVALVFSFTWIVLRMADFVGLVMIDRVKKSGSLVDPQIIPFIKEASKIMVSLVSIFFVLGALFNLDITSLIAGLGIGGLAFALAAKESIENLLGSFTIFLDKPFHVGDIIETSGVKGTVEHIGFRSTRVRTMENSLITIPNKKMVDGVLDNLSLRNQERQRMTFAFDHSTSPAAYLECAAALDVYLKQHPKIKPNAAAKVYDVHIQGSVDIVCLFFVLSTDWETIASVRSDVCEKILEEAKKRDMNFFMGQTQPHG
jgi:MscS family membrane protein